MSRKNTLAPYTIMNNVDVTSGAATSLVTSIKHLDNISIQINFTGTPVGTFYVELSDDNVNFVPMTLSPVPVASGAPGSIILEITQLASIYLRVRYAGSGAGAVTALITAKMI